MVKLNKTKKRLVRLFLITVLGFVFATNSNASSKYEVATFIRNTVLGGSLSGKTLWMSDTSISISGNPVARDVLPQMPAYNLPYPRTWVVMIDDVPTGNFGHPCRWVFLYDNNLSAYQVIPGKQFPPIITLGTTILNFECRDFTTLGTEACMPVETLSVLKTGPKTKEPVLFKDCLYAVLISGGLNPDLNFRYYGANLIRVYQILADCGFPATNIFAYYADGSDLDLDNADGDNDRHTGTSEITGAATQENIANKLTDLCGTLNPERDVIFVYVTNHGMDNWGAPLWDMDGLGADTSEIMAPEELGDWTDDCQVRRLFFVLDQCYSGEFLEPLSDTHHSRSAVYTAVSDEQYSCRSDYLNDWDNNDPATTTMNDMHDFVELPDCYGQTQTPGMAEGTPGMGNTVLCFCWAPFMDHLRAEIMNLRIHIWWPPILSYTDTSHYYLHPNGVSRVVHGTAFDPGDGLLEIPIEMMELNLYENHSAFGPYRIIESPLKNSTGRVKALQTGIQYPAESFFDVYLEILTETSPLGILVTKDPLRFQATVDTLFPLDTMYVAQDTIMLYRINSQEGPPVGRIVGADYVLRGRFDGTIISPSSYMILGNIGDILTVSVNAEPGHEPPYWYQVYGPGQTSGSGMWIWQADAPGEHRVVIQNAPAGDSLAQSCAFSVQIGAKTGDTNGDGIIDVGDVVYLINYLFKTGPAPFPLASGDCNCDDNVDVGDIVYLINYLFKGGTPPSC